MRQAIFSRVRPAVDGWSAIECACACSPAMSASPGCHEQCDAAGGPPQSGPSIGLSAIRYHPTSGLPCRTNLPTFGAIPQFDASHFNWRPQVLLRFPTRLRHAVTLALHTRNAKKIFSRTRPLESSIVCNLACNACEIHPIFSESASVSYAVDSSIDCMMLNRSRTTDFPHGPTFVGLLTLVPTRSQSALLPRAGHLGTP